MSGKRWLRGVVAGLSAGAMATSFLAVVAPGVAGADAVAETRGWQPAGAAGAPIGNNIDVTRIVSADEVEPGEEFTVEYEAVNKTIADRYFHYMQDKPPAGVTFVEVVESETEVWRSGPAPDTGGWNDPAPWDGYPGQPGQDSAGVLIDWRDHGTSAGTGSKLAFIGKNEGEFRPTVTLKYRVDDDAELGQVGPWSTWFQVEAGLGGQPDWTDSLPTVVAPSVTAPDAPAIDTMVADPDPATEGGSVTVSGTADPGSTVTVEVGSGSDARTCTATADSASGEYECTVSDLVAGDGQPVTVVAERDGLESDAATDTLNVEEASTGPEAPTQAPSAVTVDPNPVVDGAQVTVEGTVAEGSTDAQVTVGGAEVCTTDQIGADGSFSCVFTADRESMNGEDIVVTSSNEGGSSEGHDAGRLTVDEAGPDAPSAPVIDADGGLDNPYTDGETVTITGTVDDDTDEVEVAVDGATPSEAKCTITDGAFECTFTAERGLDGGEVTVTAKNETSDASSSLGAIEVEDEDTGPVAPTAPGIDADGGLDNPYVDGETVTITGTVDDDTTGVGVVVGEGQPDGAECAIEDGTFTCAFTAREGMDGDEVAVFAFNDDVPSEAADLGALKVGPAVQPGEPTITVEPEDPGVGDTVSVTVQDPSGRGGATVDVTVDGEPIPGCEELVLDENGEASCTWTPEGPGDHELEATITGADDTTTVTETVTVGDGEGDGGNGNDDGNGDGSVCTGSGSASGSLWGSLIAAGSLGSLHALGSC